MEPRKFLPLPDKPPFPRPDMAYRQYFPFYQTVISASTVRPSASHGFHDRNLLRICDPRMLKRMPQASRIDLETGWSEELSAKAASSTEPTGKPTSRQLYLYPAFSLLFPEPHISGRINACHLKFSLSKVPSCQIPPVWTFARASR